MRLLFSLLFITALGSSANGCAMFQNYYDKKAKAQEEFHDEYRVAGEEGRAEMPREKESDWLTPILQSPEARSIEKNLGYD